MTSPPFDSPDYPIALRLAARSGGRLRRALIALAAASLVILWWTGTLGELAAPERIRRLMDHAGPAAPILFIAILVPLNLVFLAGVPVWMSSTLWSTPLAITYSIAGVVVASAATHMLARHYGRDWARSRIPDNLHRFGERLERTPLRSVATLRLLLWINPGVDLLMAVSNLRLRDYLLGTLFGIALPTAVRVVIGQKGIEAASGPPGWLWILAAMAVIAALGVRRYGKTPKALRSP